MIDRVRQKACAIQEHEHVFRFLKMWYDDSTASLDRFLHITLKLTLGLQNFCSLFRFALFDGEIYPL